MSYTKFCDHNGGKWLKLGSNLILNTWGTMTKEDAEEANHIHQIFYAIVRKYLPNWSDVTEFSKSSGISLNTLRSVYYNEGQAGISTMNNVLKALLDLTPTTVAAIIEKIEHIEPVSESNQIWNSIEATEEKRIYYALVAKSVWEIDQRLEKKTRKS